MSTPTQPSPTQPSPMQSPIEMLRSAKKVVIRIHETGEQHEKKDVYIGVNGVGYLLQRGVDVEVPLPVAKVLENATQTVYDFDLNGKHRVSRQAQRYPFTYVRAA